MKRKKINIGAISSALSRSEMKEIMAGSGDIGGGGDGTGGCGCGTAPGCIYSGCSTASYFYNCLNAACMAECNTPSCQMECVQQVNQLWAQAIAQCGINYG
ncbi:hypothetical protein [Rhodohalobacter sulfatireducens]|uniref:Bacteriocin n=1 Tax=Rhodohalobacter sulfatireducens TaxID=2911366 RepID=A0ABS9KBM8_9BACT|nr:hypothetical protein [Rhodohalobacter sulfatireducens]MCG2588218.1 hypothetical protein [Rhodohalobacter sulfatireducens]